MVNNSPASTGIIKYLITYFIHYVICYFGALFVFALSSSLLMSFAEPTTNNRLTAIIDFTTLIFMAGIIAGYLISIIQFPCFLIFLSVTKKSPLSLSSSIIGGIFLSGAPFLIFAIIIQLLSQTYSASLLALAISLTLSGIFSGLIHYQLEKWKNTTSPQPTNSIDHE